MSSVIILGAGYLGKHLVREFSKLHGNIWTVKRTKHNYSSSLPICGDLKQTKVYECLPNSASTIVFCAAAPEVSENSYRDTYIDALSKSIQWWKNQSPTARFIFTSSTSVYHEKSDKAVGENTKTKPMNFRGKIMLEAENAILESNGIIARLSGLYGPERNRLEEIALNSTWPEDRIVNRIHVKDAARAIVFLANLKEPPRCINITDCKPSSLHEILRFIKHETYKGDPNGTVEKHLPNPIKGKNISNSLLLSLGFEFEYPDYGTVEKQALRCRRRRRMPGLVTGRPARPSCFKK